MKDTNGYPIRTEKGKIMTFIEMYEKQPLVAKIFYPYLAFIVVTTAIEFF
jgi:hypothetical protein